MSELCYVSVVMDNAYGIGIVKDGHRGYFKTNWPTVDTYEKAQEWANDMNDRLGLSEDEVWRLVAQSMRPI